MPPHRGEIPLVPAEACPFEVRFALVQSHRAAFGDLQDLGEILGGAEEVGTKAPKGGAGQEAPRDTEFLGGPPAAIFWSSQSS